MTEKSVKVSVALGILLLAGVLWAARDYGKIGLGYLGNSIKQNVPVVVDIDRLELSLEQLDAEIASNGRKVVEQSVVLDRYTEQVASKELALDQVKTDLKVLRGKFVSLQDEAAKKPLENAMTSRLARFKAQSKSLESTKSALANKRQAYESMLAAFEKQKLDRDILKDKLESFRAEYETMKMRGELEQSNIANSASRKANDLAIEIADRLEIQRRLANIESTSVDSLVDEDSTFSPDFDLSNVDEVIGGGDACASKPVAKTLK